MNNVFWDIETRSKCDLKKTSVKKYFRDPSTSPICIVWKVGELSYAWVCQPISVPDIATFSCPLSETKKFIEAIAKDSTWIAHNGNMFDRVFWETLDLPQPAGWADTAQLARLYGLPGGLDKVSEELIGEHKLAEESKVLKKWMKKPDATIPDEDLAQIVTYCYQDVELLSKIHAKLAPVHNVEIELREIDYQINNRGFFVDLERTAKLTIAALDKRSEAIAAVEKHGLDLRQLRSPKVLKQWYEDRGHKIVDVTKASIQTITAISAKDSPEAEVFTAREQAARASFGKFKYILDSEIDSRLCFQVAYHAAHTGRWGGRGVQPHNLPRPVLTEAETEAALIDPSKIDFGTRNVGDVYASLIRPCIAASPGSDLIIKDYSSMEVRGVHWCAGDQVRLKQHEAKEDAYINYVREAMGQVVDKKHPLRQNVKAVVLGCGFGMGAEKLEGYAKGMGMDLTLTGKTAQEHVDLYRAAHPLEAGQLDEGRYVGGLWRNLERACKMAISQGQKTSVGRCKIFKDGQHLIIVLPSGRPQFYRHAHIRKTMAPWGPTLSIFYKTTKGYYDNLYGGLLTENIVQAICRDIFAEAIVKCHKAGLEVVLHVHDEIIVESNKDSDYDKMTECMVDRPKWAQDFPLHVEGFRSPYFRKG